MLAEIGLATLLIAFVLALVYALYTLDFSLAATTRPLGCGCISARRDALLTAPAPTAFTSHIIVVPEQFQKG